MATFVALALVLVIGQVEPAHPHGVGPLALQRVLIAILLLFPYLLYRFTTGFDPPSRLVDRSLGALATGMVLWTFALPSYPEPGDAWTALFIAYLVGFLVHWTVLSTISAWRLWRAGQGQSSVARQRMRLLAAAAAVITAALFVTAAVGGADSTGAVVAQALAFVSTVAFGLGLAPPAGLRVLWRRPEQRRVQQAIESLITLATSREEMAARVLGPLADIVGADAVALRDDGGGLVGAYNVGPETLEQLERGEEPPRALRLEATGGTLFVWTSPYAPFFGEDELDLLRSVAGLTWLALDRARLFAHEHEARLGLERANELMTNFVALAAHELRTPVTSIHGFVYTLNHLGDRLREEQRDELNRTLEQQTARMARLVEQLLDLSRLDADAIDIVPQRLPVRERLLELVAATGPDRREEIAVEMAGEVLAEVDPNAFDRIVSNLVANALRYGLPPVTVRAEQTDRHFRVWVEDRGRGVPEAFVPDLFERFTRANEPTEHERVNGTGLGLAIARSYAHAHGGDILYEPAEPHGARFQFVLPVGIRPPRSANGRRADLTARGTAREPPVTR